MTQPTDEESSSPSTGTTSVPKSVVEKVTFGEQMTKPCSEETSSLADATTATSRTTATTAALSTQSPMSSNTSEPPLLLPRDVMFARPPNAPETPPVEEGHRAVHRIRLSALEHNYACVEAAANKQRCSVIVVVKADGYGHGAVATALHLADCCGADAFAVATLEEAIHLRRAFENNPPGRWSKQLASHFHVSNNSQHPASWVASVAEGTNSSRAASPTSVAAARSMRPARIRILVLGPPVGFPRCFDDYHFYGIEVMVSGPEVAAALLAWVADEKERKRTEVERAASEAKADALLKPLVPRDSSAPDDKKATQAGSNAPNGNNKAPAADLKSSEIQRNVLRHPSSTLGNVSGQDLAKEVRAILMNQKAANDASNLEKERQQQQLGSKATSSVASSSENSISSDTKASPTPVKPPPLSGTTFMGIEASAKSARAREMALGRCSSREDFEQTTTTTADGTSNGVVKTDSTMQPITARRRRLRWHALVDSGMGRLGFKTEDDAGTVDILKELVNAEIHYNAPIEFFGMCTHMADASSKSDYTNSQIKRFIGLLQRVREAGISVPTVSTDNSAALLTTSLQHFDPEQILSQPGANSRGFVRVGGAIYGQRPAFSELKAVSTLCASVRHVAILKKGETVGYDRAYVAPHDVRIATLTIGFADGYPRLLGNGVGQVEIRGALFPVAGNICMDMLMVNLGHAQDQGIGASVAVGDTAILWGPLDDDEDEGMVRLQDLAATLNTTQSALTCGLDKIRVRRQFV